MILVDANIVIAASRSKGAAIRAKIGALPVVIAGIVRCEMIKGARTKFERDNANAICDGYLALDFLPEHWINLGDNLAALRRKGISVPFADVILATIAIANDIEVWSNDRHFPMMQTVLPELKLFVEPV